MNNSKIRIAVFASGSGTNAENLIRYFSNHQTAEIAMVFCNNPSAGVLERARKLSVQSFLFTRKDFFESDNVMKELADHSIDLIVLAGFLWLIPGKLIEKYKGRIINIHPALLPGFGGKGFYGSRVHESVIKSGSPISGITIHHVNDHFDEGEIIFQAACHVEKNETPQSLAEKIHALEHTWFPVVVEKMLTHR